MAQTYSSMPSVHCGLKCFDLPVASTAADVAREFSASLNPALALDGSSCRVEVYRLQPLALDAELSPDESVVCRVPGWQFDFPALEELHRNLEELRSEHDDLIVQYGRTKEALISLSASVEASEIGETAAQRQPRTPSGAESTSRGGRREVEHLKVQLAQSEKKQQETKATVMALRNEFMHLVDVMQSGNPKGQANYDLPTVMKELDTNVKGWPHSGHSPQPSPAGSAHTEPTKPGRHPSQPPTVGGRRPVGSPRVIRTPGAFSTPRGTARQPRLHARSGHSAGAVDRKYFSPADLRQ